MRDEQPDAAQAEIDEATRKLYAAVFDLDPGTINKNGLNIDTDRFDMDLIIEQIIRGAKC